MRSTEKKKKGKKEKTVIVNIEAPHYRSQKSKCQSLVPNTYFNSKIKSTEKR